MIRIVWVCFCGLLASGAAAGNGESYILLQDSPLAGFQYHHGKSLWADMKVGDHLALIREPANAYDPRAIRVEWHGVKLGYVPRRENADIARLMDNGAKIEARITRLTESRDPWQRVRFELLVPVQPSAEPELR